ncbi:hypothetical protein [Dolichospermum phage Dfl-JY23]
MDNREVLLRAVNDINERLDELEKPQTKISNLIALGGLIVTIVAGFASTMFISVSKITTLEIRSQYMNENVLELKNEVSLLKQKLDRQPLQNDDIK